MKNFLIVIASLFLLAAAGVLWVGSVLSAPQQRAVGSPPRSSGTDVVAIARPSGGLVNGWFMSGSKARGGVLLLHSLRSDRREMIERAAFLNRAGYSVLLIDPQAHGETEGHQITFGYLESEDARAALGFLRKKVDGRPVGVIGVSLGGAAALLGDAPLDADALVLEAVYSTFEQAVENRLVVRLGGPGRLMTSLLVWQVEPRLGVSEQSLSPLAAIRRVKAPVMLIAGDQDQHTRLEDTQSLFAQAPQPKQLWIVDGASHQDLHRFAGKEYEARVLEFLNANLR